MPRKSFALIISRAGTQTSTTCLSIKLYISFWSPFGHCVCRFFFFPFHPATLLPVVLTSLTLQYLVWKHQFPQLVVVIRKIVVRTRVILDQISSRVWMINPSSVLNKSFKVVSQSAYVNIFEILIVNCRSIPHFPFWLLLFPKWQIDSMIDSVNTYRTSEKSI